jgi:hypothetical protein
MNSPQQGAAPNDRQGVLNKHKDRAKKMMRRGKDNQPVGQEQGDPNLKAGYRPGQRPNRPPGAQGQQGGNRGRFGQQQPNQG